MVKIFHEIRDPIHTFVRMDNVEREVVNSLPLQRLRHIHQLALTYCLYPGATHRRFEHSLGVMELAGRVYDVVTEDENLHSQMRELFPQLRDPNSRSYWRRVVRMAALCHDVGHLPFSHAAESDLLPHPWSHEALTAELIRSSPLKEILEASDPPLRSNAVIKVAVGKRKLEEIEYDGDKEFTDWEAILSEIVTGDAFGVDRIDYLLRDSLHAGVAYGRFDHYRLVDTLRILPAPATGQGGESQEPQLGVEVGGLRSAEALLLARYFMFSQIYYHPVRRIYDNHLRDFLLGWLPGGMYSINVDDHLNMTDNEVLVGLSESARNISSPAHRMARIIATRNHYRLVWQKSPAEQVDGKLLAKVLADRFGEANVHHDYVPAKKSLIDFPVSESDGQIASAFSSSEVLQSLPSTGTDSIFVASGLREAALDALPSLRHSMSALNEE